MGLLGSGQDEIREHPGQAGTAMGMFGRNTDRVPEGTRTGKSGPALGMSEASPAAGGGQRGGEAQVRLCGRGASGRSGGVWMTAGVLTFQCTGEDADCAEGPLSLSWLLEAIHTWSLWGQHLGPAWLLRRCGLGATRRYA